MKIAKFLLELIVITCITWGVLYYFQENIPDVLIVLVGFGVPIGVIYSEINGFINQKKFKKLAIDYEKSVACYCYLSTHYFDGEKYIEEHSSSSISYSICLSSNQNFYFYKCNKSLMTLKKFDENICVDIDSKISEIRKDKLKRFIIDDFKLNSEDKFGSWMANQVSSHIQGYFTNRVQTKVEMEGVIQIYFTDNDTDKVISLGIPSSFSSSSLDITSILPDSVTQTMGYFETGTDLLDIVNGESQFTKRAKCLVNSFLIQINAENPVECFVRS